jgi:hypothetical protein
MNWAVKTPLYPILPSWARNIETAYNILQGVRNVPVKTPKDALDKMGTISLFGGSQSALLVPLLKGYWGLVFEAFGSIDIRDKMMKLGDIYKTDTTKSIEFSSVKQFSSNIPFYFTTMSQPLTDLSSLAIKVDREVRPVKTLPRIALIVSENPFRSSLLQTELSKFGFQTRVITPRVNVHLDAKRWGADIILGIRGTPGTRLSQAPFTKSWEVAKITKMSPIIKQNWKWGKPFTSSFPKMRPGGISTKEIAKAFVDKGNWPVMTYFSLFYKTRISYGRQEKE